ncbi:APC family permease [Polaromonas eurypsychrophila]|uniref:APC family permease n=1 Tax=Polaromonas eurypsychrophila TaxID=1614635 RepID=UPI001E3F6145|nr:amino acid permease [Polaromonas eurypsychrophila]
MVWLPFLLAFAVALVTAFSYPELVTMYLRPAGAALYAHEVFGVHFITFLVAFTVMCSAITSASTASRAFAAKLSGAFGLDLGAGFGVTAVGLVFMAMVAAVTLRGVGESVKANVLLPRVELTGLLIIICIGFWAIGTGQGDVGRVMEFKTTMDGGSAFWSVIAGTSLVPPEKLAEGETPLLQVVQAGAPGFPVELFGFITMFAAANSALMKMLMARRLVYGMSHEGVFPPLLGKVHAARRTPYVAIGFTTLLAFGLITFVGEIPALGGTTALLLLAVFTVVNIAVLVLRREKVDHRHFRTSVVLPVVAALCCVLLLGPWTGRDPVQYTIAAALLSIGVLLWGATVLFQRAARRKAAGA